MRAEGEIMKKISSALLAALLLLATVFTGAPTAMAAGVSVNATTVTVYFLNQEFREKISQPAAYPASFQLKVTGADKAAYRVTAGESATVSSTGLVKPLCTRYYWYGNVGSTAPTPGKTPDRVTESYTAGDSTVQVTAGGKTFRVTVHVQSYAQVYVDSVMQDYIAKNLPANPTDYNKAETAAKFAAQYEYSANYSSYLSMVILGGGDCWASTGAVNRMCSLMGLPAWTRNGNKDAGAGSGHVNTLAQCANGTYYQIEAGFDATAPRPYEIKSRTSLFSYRSSAAGATVYQYDGSVMTYCIRCHWVLDDSRTIAHVTGVKLSATTYTYNGKVQKPSVTVKDSKGKALKSTDYKISYPKGMKNVGKYTVKVTLKGNYSGSKSMTYNINPKGTGVSKVTAAKKGFKVTWKKQATQTTGYQVQYNTNSKFKSAKTVTISKNKTTSKSVGKLSAKKKYYVRVRTYKTVKVNGKNVKLYSGWSKAKSVTTKK